LRKKHEISSVYESELFYVRIKKYLFINERALYTHGIVATGGLLPITDLDTNLGKQPIYHRDLQSQTLILNVLNFSDSGNFTEYLTKLTFFFESNLFCVL